MARSVEIARAFITLEANTKGLDQQLSQAERSLGRTAKFIVDNPIAALAGFGTAAIAAALKLADMAAEVDRSFKLIAASIPGATDRIEDFRKEAKNLSLEFGVSQKEVADGMLALAKTGISSVEDLITANRAAMNASRATGTDFGTTISLLDGVLDSFGLKAKDSEAILAKLFVTSQGKTNFTELAEIFQSVGKAAVKSGVDWTTLTEAIVTLKTEQLPLKSIITVLSKALDQEGAPAIHKFAAESHVASDGLAEMRAQTASMNDEAGVAEAQIKQRLSAALIELGRTVLPLVVDGLETVVHFLDRAFGNTNLDAASEKIGAIGASLDTLTGGKHTAALIILSGAIRDFTGDMVSAGVQAKDLSATQLKNLAVGLTAAAKASKDGSDEQKNLFTQLGYVNTEILKRATTVGPAAVKSDDAQSAANRKLTASLLATGDAAAKSAHDQIESRKILLELEKKYTGATITLAESQAQAIEALEVEFGEKILQLKGEAKDKAIALLEETKARTVAAWKAIGEVTEATIKPQIKITDDYDLSLTKLSTAHTDLNAIVAKTSVGYGELLVVYNDAIDTEKEHRQAILKTADGIARAADEMGNFLEQVGLADEASKALLHGIGDIADAVGKIANHDIFGGILAGIGGIAGIIQGLFGDSPGAAARAKLLSDNNERLRELKEGLEDDIRIRSSGAKFEGIQAGLTEFIKNLKLGSAFTGVNSADLFKSLAKFGVTMGDIDNIAKDFGLTVRNPDTGRFDIDALKQLLKLMGEINFADVGKSITDKIDHIKDLETAGVLPKEGEFAAITKALTETGSTSPGILGALGAGDVSTPGGRKAVTTALQALIANIGDLKPSDFGDLTKDQFKDVILQLLGTLLSDTVLGTSTGTGTGPTTNPNPEPVPVQSEPDPAFPPSTEADNWGSLLSYTSPVPGLLQGILDAISGPPVIAPSLPSLALASGGGGGIAFNAPVIGVLNLGGASGSVVDIAAQVAEAIRLQLQIALAKDFAFDQASIGSAVRV
jgi:Phage-related minor tail protein